MIWIVVVLMMSAQMIAGEGESDRIEMNMIVNVCIGVECVPSTHESFISGDSLVEIGLFL